MLYYYLNGLFRGARSSSNTMIPVDRMCQSDVEDKFLDNPIAHKYSSFPLGMRCFCQCHSSGVT